MLDHLVLAPTTEGPTVRVTLAKSRSTKPREAQASQTPSDECRAEERAVTRNARGARRTCAETRTRPREQKTTADNTKDHTTESLTQTRGDERPGRAPRRQPPPGQRSATKKKATE